MVRQMSTKPKQGFLVTLAVCAMRKSHFQACLKSTVSFWGELVNEMIREGRKSDKYF